MARGKHRRRRIPTVILIDLLVTGLALAGIGGLVASRLVAPSSPPFRLSGTLPIRATSAPRSIRATSRARPPVVALATQRPAPPMLLSIPAIGVDTKLIRLFLNPDRTLQVPTDATIAGWYALGPRPGEPGAAVIAGHVDSRWGSAVFYRLGQLASGDVVRIGLADRAELTFRVYAVREFPKSAFPTSLVYGPTRAQELRLVTCGGPFDDQTGHYVDSVVVFARYERQRR
jgi:hypothetical protein